MTDPRRDSARGGPPGQPPRPLPDLQGHAIGIVGIGTMGAGMAARLSATGASLRLFNRSTDRARAVADEIGGAVEVVSSPAAAADGARIVLVSVADDAAVDEVILGPAGIVRAARPVGLVVNASTVAPETVRRLAEATPILDAGVLGNGQHARDGLLRWYVGGDLGLLDTARDVLEALGQQVRHVGDVGSGMLLKLVMNLLMGIEMQALAELAAFGEAAGLSRQIVLDAIGDSGFAAPVMRFKARRIATQEYQDPDFRLRLMSKDLTLATREATACGASLPMATAVADTHNQAVESGIGELDCAAIAQFLSGSTARVMT